MCECVHKFFVMHEIIMMLFKQRVVLCYKVFSKKKYADLNEIMSENMLNLLSVTHRLAGCSHSC